MAKDPRAFRLSYMLHVYTEIWGEGMAQLIIFGIQIKVEF